MHNFMIVLKKELRDCFRDKRSLVMMLIPLLIYPLMFIAIDAQQTTADDTLAVEITFATNDEEMIAELVSALKATDLKVNVVKDGNAIDDLKSGRVMLIVDKDESGYQIVYDQASLKSSKAVGVVTAMIEAQKLEKISAVLNSHGESVDFLNEYNYAIQDSTSGTEDDGASALAMIAPMMIVLFIATGGTGFATDLFCGEKERGSLEALLSTQVSRKSLYFAKLVTTMIFGGIGVLISVSAYLLSYILTGEIDINSSSSFGASQILLILVVSISFSFFINAVVCALVISAKTVKEASLKTYLVTIIPSLLGSVTIFMETGNAPLSRSFVPVFNVLGALKSIVIDVVQPEQIIVTIFANIIYGVIFVFIGQKMMNSEKILSK